MAEQDYDPRFPDEEWNKKLLEEESTVEAAEPVPVETKPSGEGLRTSNTPTRAPQRKAK